MKTESEAFSVRFCAWCHQWVTFSTRSRWDRQGRVWDNSLADVLFRFRLHFEKESKEEVEKRKKMAREKMLQAVPERELEMDIKQVYPEEQGLKASAEKWIIRDAWITTGTFCYLTLILPDFRAGFPTKAPLALWDAQRGAIKEGKEGIWWISGGSSFQKSYRLPQPFWTQSGGQKCFLLDSADAVPGPASVLYAAQLL